MTSSSDISGGPAVRERQMGERVMTELKDILGKKADGPVSTAGQVVPETKDEAAKVAEASRRGVVV